MERRSLCQMGILVGDELANTGRLLFPLWLCLHV